ncbi:MAG TPA: CocE/NonD family hydrolase, partial [Gaiellaceae bacterium]|nr:CocE/NonD family hydrolase [Gaiellaceae bacterium]
MEHRRAWIRLTDGVRLAARLWLPDARPAAVVLEALPYRMDDLTSSYAGEYERLCEEGGLAVARVDLRGTGSSEGVAMDEYPPQEQADLVDVIAWLAAQDWSNGRVGMYGTSYSGFNSIQLAMERPPALGAICAIYATDDRYTDDVHYTGGVLRCIDLVDYVLYMAAMNVLPPVPSVFGDGWRDEWLERVESAEPWLLHWLEEQVDSPYWRHGSLRPDYERIACPTMIVAGWADGYRNNTFRTFEALDCPKRLLVGPWSHMSTATSLPGPHIDLVPELVRWFRRWLCDEENGVEAEPPISVFVRRSTGPEPDLAELRGYWRSEPGWPLDRSRLRTFTPEPSVGSDVISIRGDVGTSAWISCAGRLPWGQALDQREDDALSLVHEWA